MMDRHPLGSKEDGYVCLIVLYVAEVLLAWILMNGGFCKELLSLFCKWLMLVEGREKDQTEASNSSRPGSND